MENNYNQGQTAPTNQTSPNHNGGRKRPPKAKLLYAIHTGLNQLLDRYGEETPRLKDKELFSLAGIPSSTFYENFPNGLSDVIRHSKKMLIEEYSICAYNVSLKIGMINRFGNVPCSAEEKRRLILDTLLQWHYPEEHKKLAKLAIRLFNRDLWVEALTPCFPFFLPDQENLPPALAARQNRAFAALCSMEISEWNKERFSDLLEEKYRNQIKEDIHCVMMMGKNR